LVALFVEGGTDFGLIPATPAETVTFWTVWGLVLGAVLLARGKDRRLPEKEGWLLIVAVAPRKGGGW
jgi:hypothetical protein